MNQLEKLEALFADDFAVMRGADRPEIIFIGAGPLSKRLRDLLLADQPFDEETAESIQAEPAKRFPRRAEWLAAELKKRNLTPSGYETKHDQPTRKTIKKILDAGKVTDRTLDQLAEGLKVSPEQIPND